MTLLLVLLQPVLVLLVALSTRGRISCDKENVSKILGILEEVCGIKEVSHLAKWKGTAINLEGVPTTSLTR